MTTPTRSEHDLARLTVMRELHAAYQSYGRVPAALLREMAGALNMTERNLSRLFAQYRTAGCYASYAPKKRQDLPNEHAAKDAYFKAAGDARKAYELLCAQGLITNMSLRTFQRRVAAWPQWLTACAKGGAHEMVKHQMFNTEHIPYRTYAYGTDHTSLSIQVLPERGSTVIFPWLTFLMDLKSRVVLSWLLTEGTPTVEDSTAVIAEGIDGTEDERGFVGGKPEFLRTDRGGDFISNAINRGLLRLDVERQFTEPYSSWQNGRVERLNGTIDRNFAPTQPGYSLGGEEEYNRRVFKTPPKTSALGTLADLDDAFATWFTAYNNRPHRSLNGRSPLEAWFNDPHPVKKADPEAVRSAMLRSNNRRINKYGIDFHNKVYSSPSLGQTNCPVGSTAEIRYHAHRPNTVEVFKDGTWICTATVSREQTQNDKYAVISRRNAQKREAGDRMAYANYQRALDDRERQRAEGVPDEELPPLPVDPRAASDAPDETETIHEPRPADTPGDKTPSIASSSTRTVKNRPLNRPASVDEIDALLNPIIEESA